MKMHRRLLAVFATLIPALAQAGWLADVEVYDRTAEQTLPIYEHEGRFYVAGEPKHRYELRVRNRSAHRVLAVTSVDGVNVVTGETAAEQQSGYVIDGWSAVQIEGWRKSLDQVARFYFTRLKNSYAARTGRPDDVGVIGVALFREREVCCTPPYYRSEADAAAGAPRPSAPMEDSANASARAQKSESKIEERMGTGHGERHDSPAQYVDFQRASSTPDETIVIYYDSRKNLIAQGVLPAHPRFSDLRPRPFPSAFVPDP